MELPPELLRFHTIQYLSVQEIRKLCLVYPKLCQDDSLWKYLIKRDFGYDYQGEKAKKEYEYAEYTKYIHQMSDIPAELADQLEPVDRSNVQRFLEISGYERKENTFQWSNMDITNIYASLRSLLLDLSPYSEMFFSTSRNRIFQLLRGILPSIFRPAGDKYVVSFPILAEIYDFYNGKGSFWSGFFKYMGREMNYISPYGQRLLYELSQV